MSTASAAPGPFQVGVETADPAGFRGVATGLKSTTRRRAAQLPHNPHLCASTMAAAHARRLCIGEALQLAPLRTYPNLLGLVPFLACVVAMCES